MLSVLRWTSGTLRREPMERPLPADLALDLNTHRLLLLATRQFPDAERLERSLGTSDRRLRRVSSWPFDYEALPPSPVEHAVLSPCKRSVTLADVLALPLPRPQLVRAVFAVLAGGLVEDAPVRVAPEPLAPEPPLASTGTSVHHPEARTSPILPPRVRGRRSTPSGRRAACSSRARRRRRSRSCRMRPIATPRRAASAGCWR